MKQKSPLSLTFDDTAPDASAYDGSTGASMAMGGMLVDGLVFVRLDGVCVADYQIEKKSDGAWVLHTHVDAPWRRQGVATAIYDRVESMALGEGARLEPSSFQTEDARLFWRDRQARALPEPARDESRLAGVAARLALRRESSLSAPEAHPSERPGFKAV